LNISWSPFHTSVLGEKESPEDLDIVDRHLN
jgi:hypothetical protein